MLRFGMVSSYHPHSMRDRVERVKAKTGRTSCTNWTISFGVSGFRTRTHLLHWHFIFLNLLQLKTFSAFNMHHSKPHHQFSTIFWLHLLVFMHFMIYFELKWPWIEKHLKWTPKRFQVVSSFHPHNMCEKVERVTAKTGCTSCTNWTISFEVSGFLTRTHLLHGHFIFLNLLQLQTFLRSVRTIQSDVINFQNFLTSFAIFSHLPICIES